MSIVERTLQKLRENAPTPPVPARSADVTRVEPTAAAARRPAVNPPVTKSIVVDRRRLEESNVITSADAWRTTNEFRRLKWPLLDAAHGRDGKEACGPLLLVTSSEPGEGKTFVAINLALSIAAELEGVTLVVDGDLAKPNLSDIFGLSNYRGLTDLLTDSSLQPGDLIVGTDIPGLRILPAGTRHPNGPELLASARMERIDAWLRQAYAGTLVVFDSPPLLATNEAQALSRHVGQVLLVVRAEHTLQEVVDESIALIDKDKRLVATLNQVNLGSRGKQYGAYYGRQQQDAAPGKSG